MTLLTNISELTLSLRNENENMTDDNHLESGILC